MIMEENCHLPLVVFAVLFIVMLLVAAFGIIYIIDLKDKNRSLLRELRDLRGDVESSKTRRDGSKGKKSRRRKRKSSKSARSSKSSKSHSSKCPTVQPVQEPIAVLKHNEIEVLHSACTQNDPTKCGVMMAPPMPFKTDETAVPLAAGIAEVVSSNQQMVCAQTAPRSVDERLQEMMTPAEFTDAMRSTAQMINDYFANSEKYPVTTRLPPNHLINALPREAPRYPENYQDMLTDVQNLIMPMMTHWQHPNFLAYFMLGRSYADVLSEAVIAALGVVGFSYDACPALTELEVVMCNWLAKIFGLPKGFFYGDNPALSTGAGFFLPSASDGVFNAVMASRDWKVNRLLDKFKMRHGNEPLHSSANNKHRHEICQRLVVYASKDSHSCIEKACKMAMVRLHTIQGTAENHYGITGAQLQAQVIKDIEAGFIPMHVHITLGTTSTGACDHLSTIWPVSRKYKMWLHVDAAYSGNSWIEPSNRDMMKGLEHATSLTINLNKFFMHSAPSCVFWTQDQHTFKRAFDICPVYLKPLKDATLDLRHYGIQLTRTFRALHTWFVLRMHGVEGMRRYVNKMCSMAAYFETLLRTHPNVRMFGQRNLTLFCFQYQEPNFTSEEINKTTVALAHFINNSHELFLTRSNVAGHDIIRITVNYSKVTPSEVEKTHRILVGLIDRFREIRATTPSEIPIPIEGRNTALGRYLFDIDLRGTPLGDVDFEKVKRWAESPIPITEQESITICYNLPCTPAVAAVQDAKTPTTDAKIGPDEPLVTAEKNQTKPAGNSIGTQTPVQNEVVVTPSAQNPPQLQPPTSPVVAGQTVAAKSPSGTNSTASMEKTQKEA